MANKPLQTIKFPGLTYTYTVPQIDSNFTGTAGQVPDSKKVHDEIDSLKEDLSDNYVGYKGTLTNADNLFALTYGVYFIHAAAGNKPTNLPSDFASNHNGFAAILGTSNNSVLTAIAVDLYAKKVWLYTGYGWNEIPNTDRVNALITPVINSALNEIEDSSIVTNIFASKFRAWGWNGNSTRGFHADSTRLSIISPQYCPYDIVLSNLSSIFSVATVRTFTGTSTVPSNLVSTTQYNVNKGINGYVDSIVLPKNAYWTIELSKPNNVDVDASNDPEYLHFAIATTIVGDTLKANKTLLVGKTNAPYATIQSACDDAINGDTILILPGTYVEQVSIWGKRLNLIGLNRETTIIKDTSGLYSTPTLEMNIGSLKNLTIIETCEDNPFGADEGRSYAYAMHIESGDGYTGIGELWVDNCKFINNKHAAIGCGLYQDLHVHFNNCYMYSGRASDLPDDYYRGTFYFHTNRQDNITGQRMTVKDCEIINEGTQAFYGGVVSPGAQTGNVRSTFINNNFYAMEAETQNSNDLIISSSILNYHDCKLAPNSRGNNIPALNAT